MSIRAFLTYEGRYTRRPGRHNFSSLATRTTGQFFLPDEAVSELHLLCGSCVVLREGMRPIHRDGVGLWSSLSDDALGDTARMYHLSSFQGKGRAALLYCTKKVGTTGLNLDTRLILIYVPCFRTRPRLTEREDMKTHDGNTLGMRTVVAVYFL